MKITMRKYRVVRDAFRGYEAQDWRLWWPFWLQMGFTNTHITLDDAIKYIENHKSGRNVVWQSDKNTET